MTALVISLGAALAVSLLFLFRSHRRLSVLRQDQQRVDAERAALDQRLQRFERERQLEREQQRQSTLEGLLDVDDHVQRALALCGVTADSPALSQGSLDGIELLARELDRTWVRAGLTRIRPDIGERFDPTQHEAIAVEHGDGVSEPIVDAVERDGFRCGERLLRPARVVVRMPDKQA